MLAGEGFGQAEPVRLDLLAAACGQPSHLAGVGRQDQGGVRSLQHGGVAHEGVETVCVDHDRYPEGFHQSSDELLGFGVNGQSGTQDHDRFVCCQIEQDFFCGEGGRLGGGFGNRYGHCLGQLLLQNGIQAGGCGQGDQARAGPQGGEGGHGGRPGLSDRSGDDQGVTEASLVRVGGSGWKRRADRAHRRQRNRDRRLPDQTRGDADIHDLENAAMIRPGV